MTALSAAKTIIKLDGPDFIGPLLVAKDAIIYHGALVGISGGYAKAAASTDDIIVGVANLSVWDDKSNIQGTSFGANNLPGTAGNKVDNTGGNDGDRQVVAERGVFKFRNKTGDLLAQTDIGGTAYVEDDQTVRATAGGGIAAGTVIRIDDDGGVFVQVPAGAYGQF
jgi:hypothetical protein